MHKYEPRKDDQSVKPLDRVEAYTFALSSHQMQDLVQNTPRYEGNSYLALNEIAQQLRAVDIDANLVAGGVNFYLTINNAAQAAQVLARFKIDLSACTKQTFSQELNSSPHGLEGLAASGNSRAQQILDAINNTKK